MKKFLYLTTILALLASTALAIHQRDYRQKLSSQISHTKQSIAEVTSLLGAEEDEQDRLAALQTQITDERNLLSAKLEEIRLSIRREDRKIDTARQDLTAITQELSRHDDAVRRVFGDEGLQTAEDLTNQQTALQDRLDSIEDDIASEQIKLAKNQELQQLTRSRVGEEEDYQITRATEIARRDLQGTVIAANQDWGFSMVSLGSAHGLQETDRFLVKRGNQHIGNMQIIHIQDTVAVCEPDSPSRVGDKVILDY